MTTNTIILMLLVSMLALFLLKVPVYISMSLAGCAVLATRFGMKWSLLSQYLYTGVDSFTLLSIPLFLLAAKIMNTGSITKKLFSFCMKVVGWLPGGLGHVNVLCSVIFAGMSGTAVSDAGGLGSIEIKAMNENGFDNDFSCCVTAASSTLGPIIPPSIPLVVYATVSGASVGALFMAGIIPGLVMAILMMVLVSAYAILRHYPRTKFPSGGEFFTALKDGFLPLMAPVILLVGIYGGVFTPTESAAIVVCYSLFLEICIYRELTLEKFISILKETFRDSVTIALIIAGATFFGYVATRVRIPQLILKEMTGLVSSQFMLLLLINIFLLVIGCFLETASAITIVVPLIMPLLKAYHVNLTQFGIIMVLNLMIGLLTPPFGLVLFVVSKIGHISVGHFSRALLPWLACLLIALMLITFVPSISLWFPTFLGMTV
ncbi:TRAP transporter large permease [Acidaminococcus fermentans]|uniref:TRAP transporter large permease n=1 Tax=Acidaminococcus fermentans TaxID=905 RepID=UPI00242A9B91|nr:TRAP transporter large permease [Acidaminococcus fermentans]MCF0139050.1 TRAP transporter large permease [Acidaminococcus fermentans]MDD6287161.1 TRAP transporter large permease [Acidaminococcus fermentans]